MIYTSDNSLCDLSKKIQDDLNAVTDWMRSNLLVPNIKKTMCMLIGSRQKLKDQVLHVSMYGCEIKHTDKVKYLGIHIDRNLNWNAHVKSVINRAFAKLHSIRRLQPLPSTINSIQGFCTPCH